MDFSGLPRVVGAHYLPLAAAANIKFTQEPRGLGQRLKRTHPVKRLRYHGVFAWLQILRQRPPGPR